MRLTGGMRARLPFVALALGLAAAAFAGHTLRLEQDAERLTDRARRLLFAPLQKVADLEGVEAARARALLAEATRLRDSPSRVALLHYAKALDYFQRERFESATEQADAAQAGAPAADLHVLRAHIAQARQDLEGARKHLGKALAAEPQHRRARRLKADLSLDAGKPLVALELVEALIAEAPGAGSLYNRRGLIREALGHHAEALKDYRRAAELEPGSHQPQLNLGRLLRDAGKLERALLAFGRAKQHAPSNADAWVGSGLCRAQRGDIAGARADFEHAHALGTAGAAPLLALADLDSTTGQLARAHTRYRAATALEADNAVAWLKLGNNLVRLGQPTEAAAAFRSAIDLDSRLAAAHNGLGAALMRLDQPSAAADALQRAAELDRDDPNPLLNLAQLHRRSGNLADAQQAQQRAQARMIR